MRHMGTKLVFCCALALSGSLVLSVAPPLAAGQMSSRVTGGDRSGEKVERGVVILVAFPDVAHSLDRSLVQMRFGRQLNNYVREMSYGKVSLAVDAKSGKESYMGEPGQRMLDGSQPPDAKSVAQWLGTGEHRRWTRRLSFVEANYPGVFTPDWILGGKKYGWGLRFKKSKSFCTLVPERNRLVVPIVLGADERAKAEKILPELSPSLRMTYAEATTYHDGKWLAIVADCDTALDDIERLLVLKRRPKRA